MYVCVGQAFTTACFFFAIEERFVFSICRNFITVDICKSISQNYLVSDLRQVCLSWQCKSTKIRQKVKRDWN